MTKKFNEFRFEGLNYRTFSNKYWTMGRVNDDETKIVVRVADEHLIKTRYGYALILDFTHVVFLKDWQVSVNYYGNEVLLNKDFWNVKEWGEHADFFPNDPDNHDWDHWVTAARCQRDADTMVKWNRAD